MTKLALIAKQLVDEAVEAEREDEIRAEKASALARVVLMKAGVLSEARDDLANLVGRLNDVLGEIDELSSEDVDLELEELQALNDDLDEMAQALAELITSGDEDEDDDCDCAFEMAEPQATAMPIVVNATNIGEVLATLVNAHHARQARPMGY